MDKKKRQKRIVFPKFLLMISPKKPLLFGDDQDIFPMFGTEKNAVLFAAGAGARQFVTGEIKTAENLLKHLEEWHVSCKLAWLNERLVDERQIEFRTRVSWTEFLEMLKSQIALDRSAEEDEALRQNLQSLWHS